LKNGQGFHHSLYDTLVFAKMKAMLGGKVRVMITGSAPIAGDVLDFLKICFSAFLYEGYGMTETCAGSCTTFANDPETGIVGGPLMNVKLRLRDIPEMQYLHTQTPPKGEVCFWGPGITKGYFKNEEKTAEAFHGEWLLSGDVGQINPNGSLKIIDRAKNIFKLSHGEYIAPEKCENVYTKSTFVGNIWIYGDSLRDYIIGFVVIDPASFKKFCVANGIEWNNDDATPVLTNMVLKQAILDDFNKLAAEAKFNSLEKPKQLTLILDPWTVENDMLTPTQKLKRNIAKIQL
jgi:long-chain acyl-CoA synthetase